MAGTACHAAANAVNYINFKSAIGHSRFIPLDIRRS